MLGPTTSQTQGFHGEQNCSDITVPRRTNPLGLLPAWQLYQNDTYALLHDKYGSNHLYILSAGWGLISADFLTPYYDITFSRSADRYKHRDAKDRYNDFCMLPTDIAEPVVFFGGKSYVPLFCRLTMHIREKKSYVLQFQGSARCARL